MSFMDEVYYALTGGRSRGGSSFGARLEAIVAEAGSGRKAAKLLGIGETTLREWRKGRGSKTAAGRAAREARLDKLSRAAMANPAVMDRWRNNNISVIVTNVPGRGGGTRTLGAGALNLAPGTGANVVRHWLAGRDREAAQAFRAGIRDPWYRDVMFGEWMDDDDLAYEGDAYDDTDYAVGVAGVS